VALTAAPRPWLNGSEAASTVSGGIESSPRLRRLALRAGLPVAVGLSLFACYWLTLAPTITEGDSGELVTAVHTMGIAHPTGYPLYLIVGKLFDLLPLGEPARRVALLSAASAAASGGLVCWVLISITCSGPAGLLGGLLAGLNWWVWQQANQPEVYAFNLLMVWLVITMFVRWSEDPTPRRLNVLAFFCGLALTHHRSAIFFAAPLLLWAVVNARPLHARALLRAAGYGALPLLLYLWLPLRSATHPFLNWGNTSASLRYFWDHISASLYYRYVFAEPPDQALTYTRLQFVRMWVQFRWAGLLLTAVGVVGLLRSPRQRPLAVGLIAGFALIGTWAAFYAVPDKDVFYMPSAVVVSAWCGAGAAFVLRAAGKLKISPAVQRLVPIAGAAVALALPLDILMTCWRSADRSQQYRVLDAATISFAGIPGDAVLLLSGDEPKSGALYYYHVLGHRPQPQLLGAEMIVYPWYEPLLSDPGLRAVVADARLIAPQQRLPWLARSIRSSVDPRRSLYTNIPLDEVPPGYVLLTDALIQRVVLPPGIPQAADGPGARPLLEFPGGAGSLVSVATPTEAARGEPFTVTAAVRWKAAARPQGDLQFLFVHSDLAQQVATSGPDAAPERSQMRRAVPVLFAATMPPSKPGRHYEQSFNALVPRRNVAGRYQVFVRLQQGNNHTPFVSAGSISVR